MNIGAKSGEFEPDRTEIGRNAEYSSVIVKRNLLVPSFVVAIALAFCAAVCLVPVVSGVLGPLKDPFAGAFAGAALTLVLAELLNGPVRDRLHERVDSLNIAIVRIGEETAEVAERHFEEKAASFGSAITFSRYALNPDLRKMTILASVLGVDSVARIVVDLRTASNNDEDQWNDVRNHCDSVIASMHGLAAQSGFLLGYNLALRLFEIRTRDAELRSRWREGMRGLKIRLDDFDAVEAFATWFFRNYALAAQPSTAWEDADLFFVASLTFITRMHLLRKRGLYRDKALQIMEMSELTSETFRETMRSALDELDELE